MFLFLVLSKLVLPTVSIQMPFWHVIILHRIAEHVMLIWSPNSQTRPSTKSPTMLPMLSKIRHIPSAPSFNKYILNFYMHKALDSSYIPKCEKYVGLILSF